MAEPGRPSNGDPGDPSGSAGSRVSTINTAAANNLHSSLNSLALSPTSAVDPRSPTSMTLPPSPAINAQKRLSDRSRVSSPNPQTKDPLARTASVMSQRSASPALSRRGSTQSLREPGTPRKASSRRESGLSGNSPSVRTHYIIEEKDPPTAAQVAEDYFQRELALHEGDISSGDTKTAVILHDSCYGHRFSRLKTNKTGLSMIVERPERILASVLGVAAAYVRLGERHAGGAYEPHLDKQPEKKLPFKIRKTSRTVDLTSTQVTNVHGTPWMEELKELCIAAGENVANMRNEVQRNDVNAEQLHSGDLYLCRESLAAMEGALGGVLDGVDTIFEGSKTKNGPSRAFVCIRPPGHHCSDDYPSGFCWLNNVHVGIQHAAHVHGLTHAAIIDFDLHHGDGSQQITWAHNARVNNLPKNAAASKKTAIGYFSLHDINSFPCEGGDMDKVQAASLCIENAHSQTVWNTHLQPWKYENEFWELYETRYKILLEKARHFLKTHTARLANSIHPNPKAAIFLSAGFDASEWEGAGMQRHKVNVPTEFYARFTKDVTKIAEEEGSGCDGRVISVLEGGYSDRALTSGVLSHISGLCDGQPLKFEQERPTSNGLNQEMSQRMSNLNLDGFELSAPQDRVVKQMTYDRDWWNENNLEALEALATPEKAQRGSNKRHIFAGPTSHYSSPTASAIARAKDPSKVQRAVSGTGAVRVSPPRRAPTPPPANVDWATAAHELSRLLIPKGRQTKSCRPEDLAVPTVKKERTNAAPAALPDHSGRQLRGRKPRNYADNSDDDNRSMRSVSSSSRRQTIADFQPGYAASSIEPRGRANSRRLSDASMLSTAIDDGISSRPMSRATTALPSRPPTAASSRPPSSIGMKKTRAPAAPKAARPNATNGSKPRNSQNAIKEDEVDDLTSGLKKISLKMSASNQQEYEAQQKEKAAVEAEKKKAATKPIARKAPAARTTKPQTTKPRKKPTAKEIQTGAVKPVEVSSDATIVSPAPVMPKSNGAASVAGAVEPALNSDGITNLSPEYFPDNSHITSPLPLPETTSPPRPDTPPPPPPAKIPTPLKEVQAARQQAPVRHSPDGPIKNTVRSLSQMFEQNPTKMQWMPPNPNLTPRSTPSPQLNATITGTPVRSNSVRSGSNAGLLSRPTSMNLSSTPPAIVASKPGPQMPPTFSSTGYIPFAPVPGQEPARPMPGMVREASQTMPGASQQQFEVKKEE